VGQKVNPKAFRLGPLYTWDSRWFAHDRDYKDLVLEDFQIRRVLLKRLQPAGITRIEIERSINKINITLHVVRPGMVIGRGGSGMEELKRYIEKLISLNRKSQVGQVKIKKTALDLRVEPVKEPYLNAYFIASQIAEQLTRRMPHTRVVVGTLEKVMAGGAKGVKIALSGRIAGAEISRREVYKQGSIPLSTIRENVEFAKIPSATKSGYIGVKVWVCK
jgi:small subunit ribosomal protein S3